MKTKAELIEIFTDNGIQYTENENAEVFIVRYFKDRSLNSKRCKAWRCPSAEHTGKPWKVEFKGKFVKWCRTRDEAQELIDTIES
jgi:hypothetical protein